MKSFFINTKTTDRIKLSELDEDYIIITSVQAENIDLLSNQQFEIITSYPDGRKFFQLMHTGAYISPYAKGSEVFVRFPIDDCKYTEIRVVRGEYKANYKFSYITLSEMLSQKVEERESDSDKVASRVKNWQDQVVQINNNIEIWVKELQNVDVKKEKVKIVEERTGEYESEKLELTFPKGTFISFEPMGTYLLGASGRINIFSNVRFFSNYILVLQETDGVEVWYLVKNRNRVEKREFNKSQLYRVIEDAISKEE